MSLSNSKPRSTAPNSLFLLPLLAPSPQPLPDSPSKTLTDRRIPPPPLVPPMLPLHRRETTSPSYETESLLPCFSLSFSLSLFSLFISPPIHTLILLHFTRRLFVFHSAHNFVRLLAVTASTFVPSLFHSNRLIVPVSLTQPRIVNHRGPSFLPARTHARIHTYPIDQTLSSSLSFKLLLPPSLFNCSFHRDQHTLSFCFIIS